MNPTWRYKFYHWIRRAILKIDDGKILPDWALPLAWLLFPIQSIRWWPKADPRYEPQNGQMIIRGIRYSMVLFDAMGHDPFGQVIRILRRENEGVTLQRLYDREWNNAEDRLPEKGQRVLLFLKRGFITSGGYDFDVHRFFSDDTWLDEEVSHWMILPESPESVI